MNTPEKPKPRFDGLGGEGYERLRGRIPFGWLAGGLTLAFVYFGVDCHKDFEKQIPTTFGATLKQGACHGQVFMKTRIFNF